MWRREKSMGAAKRGRVFRVQGLGFRVVCNFIYTNNENYAGYTQIHGIARTFLLYALMSYI